MTDKKTIVVIGATGKVGTKVSEGLLKAGHAVRLVARGEEKLLPFAKQGAEIFPISVLYVDKLTNVLKGADAVLTMIGSNDTAEDFLADQRQQADAQVAAIKQSGIRHVVNLSSVGAHTIEDNGVMRGLAEMEVLLNRLPGVNVLHLRPNYFMENAFYTIDVIKHHGINALPVKGNIAFPMIATKDVAAVAVEKLAALDFRDKSVLPILGPRDYTLQEVTQQLGKAIGKPDLPYVEILPADFIAGILAGGRSQSFAETYLEAMTATNNGLLNYEKRTPENTTLTTIEAFAKGTFAPVFHHS